MGISSIAISGLLNAQDRFSTAAAGVVRASSTSEDTVDLSQQAVDMLGAKNQFSVMTRVVDVTDQMQKSLLDILA